jgi:RND family efflux transporter MFP subunit
MKSYRTAFFVAVIANALLLAVLAGFWWRRSSSTPKTGTQPEAAASASGSIEAPTTSAPTASETPLVPVQISPQRLQSIGVKIGTVQLKSIEDEIDTTGNVAVDETKLAYVQVRYSGYIQKVFVDATYQYVQKGQPLCTIYSPDIVATEREYLVAKQNQQQVSQSTVSGVAAGAASLVDAALERLKQWGISQREIARLESSGQVQQEIEVDSPVSGYVTERNALPSVAVQPEMRLYTIADLSTVWVQAQAFQQDLGRIRVGDSSTLTVDSFPGRTFNGRVDFVYPQVDMDTRTAKVRLVFPNRDMQLKPGMFVNVALKIPLGRQLVVPASGVLQSGTRDVAFVRRSDGYIEPRDVQLGERVGDSFVVLKGLKSGEQIVTSANFLIDSESQLQAALGSFTPPAPSAGTLSPSSGHAANLELTSDPDPPRKGSDTFRVKLTDATGLPISDAEVTVTLSMPAMPGMGMAATSTSITLSEKASGIYEGRAELQTGGTWQVAIVAKKAGQTIATKQTTATVAGGM